MPVLIGARRVAILPQLALLDDLAPPSAVAVTLSAAAAVAGTAVGTIVGLLDVVPEAALADFALTGDGGGRFKIEGTALKVAGALTAGNTTVTVKATDSNGNVLTKSFTIAITDPAAVAPANVKTPFILGIAKVGNTLTVSSGEVSGSPVPTITFQWTANGVPIAGATGTSYKLVPGDEGKTIGCERIATNKAGTLRTAAATIGPVTGSATGTIVRPTGLDYDVPGFGFPYDYARDVPSDALRWSNGNGGASFPNTADGMKAFLDACRAANKPGFLDTAQTYAGNFRSYKLPVALYGRPGVVVQYAGPAVDTSTPCFGYIVDRNFRMKGVLFQGFGSLIGAATRSVIRPEYVNASAWSFHGSSRSAYGTRRFIAAGTDTFNGVGIEMDYSVYPLVKGTVGPSVEISDCTFVNCEHVLGIWSDTLAFGRVDFHRNVLDGTYGGVSLESLWWKEIHAVNNEWMNCDAAHGRQIPSYPKANRFHTLFKLGTDATQDVDVSKQTVTIVNNYAHGIEDIANFDGTNAAVFFDGRQVTPSVITGTDPYTMTMDCVVGWNRIIGVKGLRGQEDANALYGKTRGLLVEGNYIEDTGARYYASGSGTDGSEATGFEFKQTGNMAAQPTGTALIFRGNEFVNMPPKDLNPSVMAVVGTNDISLSYYVIGNIFRRCDITGVAGNAPGVLRAFGKVGKFVIACNVFDDCLMAEGGLLIGLHQLTMVQGATGADCEVSNNEAFWSARQDFTAARQLILNTRTISGIVTGRNVLHGSGGDFAMAANFGSGTAPLRSYTKPTVSLDGPPDTGPILIPASSREFAPVSSVSTQGTADAASNSMQKKRNNTSATLTKFRVQTFRTTFDINMNLVRTTSNDILDHHALEIGGVRNRMRRGGNDDFILATTDDVARGDPLDVTLGAGETAFFRTWRSIPAGAKTIGHGGTVLATLGEGGNYAGPSVALDRTMSGSPAVADMGGPPAILWAEAPAGTKSALVIGDSIAAYLNENYTGKYTGDPYGNIGAPNRWLAMNGYNSLNIARPSTKVRDWAEKDISLIFDVWLAGATFNLIFILIGRNDLNALSSGADIAGWVAKLIAKVPPAWRKYVVVSDIPMSTGGDRSQVETQTVSSNEAQRLAFRSIVQAKGIPGMTHFFDYQTPTSAVKGNGDIVWKPNFALIDGYHPEAPANDAAAQFNLNLLAG